MSKEIHTMSKKIKTLLLGLGNIGMMYDYNKNNNKIMTHAKAIKINPKLEFVGAVDPNIKKRNLFKKKYKIIVDKTIYPFKKKKIELVVIAAPHSFCYKIIKQVLKIKTLRAIFIEKPGANNLISFRKILSLIKKKKIFLMINYQRFFFKNFSRIIKILKKSKYYQIQINYSRGVYNNCSHFIFFINFFLINLKKIKIYNYYSEFKKDKNLDFEIKFENGSAIFLYNNLHNNSHTEIKILTDKCLVESCSDFTTFKVFSKKKDNEIMSMYNYSKESLKINQIEDMNNVYKSFLKFNHQTSEDLIMKCRNVLKILDKINYEAKKYYKKNSSF